MTERKELRLGATETPQQRCDEHNQDDCPLCGLQPYRGPESYRGPEMSPDMDRSFHVDMCPDCGAVPFQHPLDPPWFCDHPRDLYVMVECAPVDDRGELVDDLETFRSLKRRLAGQGDKIGVSVAAIAIERLEQVLGAGKAKKRQ